MDVERARADGEREQKRVTAHLARVADEVANPDDLERQIRAAAAALAADAARPGALPLDAFVLALMRCSLELAHKAPIYGTLAALLAAKHERFGARFAEKLVSALLGTFQNLVRDGAAPRCARVLRILGELANARALAADSLARLLRQLLALAVAPSAATAPFARRLFFAEIALSALPWCGATLNRDAPELLQELLVLEEQFAALYADEQLVAQLAAPIAPALAAAAASGGVPRVIPRFLLLRSALRELAAENAERCWLPSATLKPYLRFSLELAQLEPFRITAEISIPAHTKLSRYSPPAFVFNLELADDEDDDDDDDGGGRDVGDRNGEVSAKQRRKAPLRADADRLVVYDYAADVLEAFASNHKKAGERLMTLPLALDINAQLVEAVMSLMLSPCAVRSPLQAGGGEGVSARPPLVYYGVVLLDMCRLKGSRIPLHLLGATEQLYELCSEQMDAEAFDRLVEWFSYHLNNFGFRWNWSDWQAAAAEDAAARVPFQQLFCRSVLDRLVRYSSHTFMSAQLPSELHALLPPAPAPVLNALSGSVAPAIEALTQVITGKGRLECAQVRERLADLVQAPLSLAAQSDSAQFGADERQLPQLRSVEDSRFVALLSAILVASVKTFSHFDIISARYVELLRELRVVASHDAQLAILSGLRRLWASSSMHVTYFVGRLLTLDLVEPVAVLRAMLPADASHTGGTWDAAKAQLLKLETWECVRLVVDGGLGELESAKRAVTRAAVAASYATEGEAEFAAEKLNESRKRVRELNELCERTVRHALTAMVALCAAIEREEISESNSAGIEDAQKNERKRAAERRVLRWRLRGMAREIERKNVEVAAAAQSQLDVENAGSDVAALREELATIAGSCILTQVG